ncbi:MAG TPA: hypothetical protein VF621_05370, partial [Pyrinomonadaceae bacterium]
MRTRSKSERLTTRVTLLLVILLSSSSAALADQLRLADGTTMEVDEAWEDSQGVWYRRGGVTNLVDKSRVREVVKASAAKDSKETKAAGEASVVKTVADTTPKVEEAQTVWIHLVGG